MADNKLATIGPDMFSDARLQLIRNTVAKDAPPDVFAAMIEIARVRGLDPLAKQISVIKFKDSWQVMTTIDGYRALAEQSDAYAGQDEPVHEFDGTRLVSTSVTVYKIVQGMRVPFTAKVYFSEYDGGNFTWKRMPITMLTKVAESHALRKAFPSILSGLYTREEMDQAEHPAPIRADVVTGEIIDADPLAESKALKANVMARAGVPTVQPDPEPVVHEKRDYSPIYAAGKAKGLMPDDVKALAYHHYDTDSMTKIEGKHLFEFNAYLNDTDPEDLAQDLYEAKGGA